MSRYRILIASLLALAFLCGCEKEQAAAPKAAPKAAAKPPAKAAPPSGTAAAAAVSPPPDDVKLVYVVAGRRDPFVPLVGKKVAAFSDNPLESFDLVQFRIKGLVIGLGEPKVLVTSPDGKSHILKKGDLIGKNGGEIVEINRTKILVREQIQDFTGKKKTTIQEIPVPVQEGV